MLFGNGPGQRERHTLQGTKRPWRTLTAPGREIIKAGCCALLALLLASCGQPPRLPPDAPGFIAPGFIAPDDALQRRLDPHPVADGLAWLGGDVAAIVSAQETRLGWLADRRSATARLQRHRFHLIDAGRYTAGLRGDSKLKPDKGLLTYLHGAGRIEARKWLERHRASVGRQSTVDLRTHFLDTSQIEVAEPSAEDRPRAATVGSHAGT